MCSTNKKKLKHIFIDNLKKNSNYLENYRLKFIKLNNEDL